MAGDRPALERAVSNLVQNAIQHGGRRGVITLRVHGVRAVEVCDQGDGVPPGWREDIFKPFVKESPHSTGAGLGLNPVARIIRRHGGEVSVASGRTAAPAFALIFPSLATPMSRPNSPGVRDEVSRRGLAPRALPFTRARGAAVLAWPAILCAGLAGTGAALATASPMFWFNLVYLGVVLLILACERILPYERAWQANDGEMREDLAHTLFTKGVAQLGPISPRWPAPPPRSHCNPPRRRPDRGPRNGPWPCRWSWGWWWRSWAVWRIAPRMNGGRYGASMRCITACAAYG